MFILCQWKRACALSLAFRCQCARHGSKLILWRVLLITCGNSMELVWSFHSNFKPSYIYNIYIDIYIYMCRYMFIYKSMSYVLHVSTCVFKWIEVSHLFIFFYLFFPAPGLQLPQVERIEPAAWGGSCVLFRLRPRGTSSLDNDTGWNGSMVPFSPFEKAILMMML